MRRLTMMPLAAALVLSACGTSGSLPAALTLPQPMPQAQWFQAVQTDAAGQTVQATLLAVEPFAGEGCPDARPQYCLRFVQTDALGAPVSRQILSASGRWANDGFLPPNPQARRLFGAVAQQHGFAADADTAADNGGRTVSRQKQKRWTVQQENGRDVYIFSDQTRWQVSPIEE